MNMPADEFLSRHVSQQPHARWIYERAQPIRSEPDDSFGRGFQQQPDARLTFGEFTLRLAQLSTSRPIADAPAMRPSESKTGEMLTETSIDEPSLHTRIVSDCSIR